MNVVATTEQIIEWLDDNGIHYEEKDKKFYFLSVRQYISQVFQQDQLEFLLKDWYENIHNEFEADELRDFKLNIILQ